MRYPRLPFREIDYRSALVAVEGKLRGSSARSLGDTLEALFADGYDQVVLDIRRCESMDSLAALALGRALGVGQGLFVVAAPGFPLDDFLPPEVAACADLRRFGTPADAVRAVRSRDESGVLSVREA